jgi:TatD DNase family protein
VGCDLDDSRAAIVTASAHDDVWATAGVHPHEASYGVEGLADLLSESKVVAVGEAGLDFHYDHSPRDAQRDVFAAQVGLANAHDLPLVIHTREAWEETFALLDVEGVPNRTVFHCFTGGPDEAREGLERGALLSFSGIITFRTADDLRSAAAVCPLDRVMVETDSPFLAPVPHRGKANEPAHVVLVGAAVAEAMGRPVDEVAEATTANARAFYALAGHGQT